MMSDDDRELVDIFMQAQAKPEGRMFSENVLAGIKAVLAFRTEALTPTRYLIEANLEGRQGDEYAEIDESEHEDGEWVKWDDIKHLFAANGGEKS